MDTKFKPFEEFVLRIKNGKYDLLSRTSSLSQYTAPIVDRRTHMKIWKDAYRDLKNDLKNTRWLRGLGWFAGAIWFLGLAGTAILIGYATLSSSKLACQPDGSFRLHPETYSMWSSSGFFQITLGGGHLTFAQAKVIDIVWDIVIHPVHIYGINTN